MGTFGQGDPSIIEKESTLSPTPLASRPYKSSPDLLAVREAGKPRAVKMFKPSLPTKPHYGALLLGGSHNTSLPSLLWIQAGESLPWAAAGVWERPRQQLPQEFGVGQVGRACAWGFRSESLPQSDPDLWAGLVEVGLADPPRSGLPEGTILFCHLLSLSWSPCFPAVLHTWANSVLYLHQGPGSQPG